VRRVSRDARSPGFRCIAITSAKQGSHGLSATLAGQFHPPW
jgi:hypothetical protein